MKFHVLAWEVVDDDKVEYGVVRVRFFSSHQELTRMRHDLKHRNAENVTTFPTVEVPTNKKGLLYMNQITLAGTLYDSVAWFASNFKEESEKLLGEGCIDES
jgi:hypothetical protein